MKTWICTYDTERWTEETDDIVALFDSRRDAEFGLNLEEGPVILSIKCEDEEGEVVQYIRAFGLVHSD